jgi:hypothetical protein
MEKSVFHRLGEWSVVNDWPLPLGLAVRAEELGEIFCKTLGDRQTAGQPL